MAAIVGSRRSTSAASSRREDQTLTLGEAAIGDDPRDHRFDERGQIGRTFAYGFHHVAHTIGGDVPTLPREPGAGGIEQERREPIEGTGEAGVG